MGVPMINEAVEDPQTESLKPLPRDSIQTVTSGTFTRLVLEAEGPVAVEFMSYGCAHCRAIESVLEQVAKMAGPREKIYRVNIAVEQELAGIPDPGGRLPWSCFSTKMK